MNQKILWSAILVVCLTWQATVMAGSSEKASLKDRGKYLVMIGGCKDCHTAGFALAGGSLPEDNWLLGDKLGFRGPWGTTYPTNLRSWFSQMTEEKWVESAKVLRTRPPMPWWVLNEMTEDDARALYSYVTSLEVIPSEVPNYVPPDVEPEPPYVQFPAPPPGQ